MHMLDGEALLRIGDKLAIAVAGQGRTSVEEKAK
jgi:hypothetical protein